MKKEKLYRVFSHLPELLTERLTLRKMLVTDTQDMYEYACRSDVTKYLTWHFPRNACQRSRWARRLG